MDLMRSAAGSRMGFYELDANRNWNSNVRYDAACRDGLLSMDKNAVLGDSVTYRVNNLG